jgi:hypothetical protein
MRYSKKPDWGEAGGDGASRKFLKISTFPEFLRFFGRLSGNLSESPHGNSMVNCGFTGQITANEVWAISGKQLFFYR